MSNTYNLFSDADMKKFMKDIEKEAVNEAKKSIEKDGYETTCPHCGASVTIHPGKETACPKCGTVINAQWKK